MSESEKPENSVGPTVVNQGSKTSSTKKQPAPGEAANVAGKPKANAEKFESPKESVGLAAAIQGLQTPETKEELVTEKKTKAPKKTKTSVKRSINPTSSLGSTDLEGDADVKASARRTTRSVQRDKVDDLLTTPENFKNAMDERFPEGEPILFVDLEESFRRSRGERVAKAGITHVPHIPNINIVDALNGGAKLDFSSQED